MLGRLFKRRRTQPDPTGVDELARVDDDDQTPRYPPFARGLPGTPVSKVLKTQEGLVRELRHSVGLAPESFDALIWPVVERLAGWVHLLPASEAHHHRMTGGLMRHSLEVGLYSARMAEGTVFVPMGTPMQRRAQEPRWHAGVAIAGLLHDIGKPVSDLTVTDDDGDPWNPYTHSLQQWITANDVERYFLRWRAHRGRRHEQFAGLVAERLLPSATASWLAEGGTEILEHVLSTITASVTDTRFAQLVFDSDHESVERDLRANNAPTEPSLGVPVDRHILDAMRRLLAQGAWQANTPGARVWVLKEGVFVVWERGCEDIVELLKHDRVPGIPRHPDALADALLERGHAHMRTIDETTRYRYWLIQPACVGSGTVVLKALQLSSPALLWPEAEAPASVAAWVGEKVDATNTGRGMHEPAPQTPESPPAPAASQPARPGARVGQSQPMLPATDAPANEASAAVSEHAEPEASAVGTYLTVTRTTISPVEDAGNAGGHESQVSAPGEDPSGTPSAAAPTEAERASGSDTGASEADAQTAAALPGGDEPPSPAPQCANGDGAATASREADATAHVPAAAEPDDLETLRGDSDAGAVLAAMAAAIRAGTTNAGDCFRTTQAGLLLIYPEPVRPYIDKPNQFLKALKAQQWFEPDPDNPLRPVRKVDGVEGILLTRELARRLHALIAIEPAPRKESAMTAAIQHAERANETTQPIEPQAQARRPRRRGPGKPTSNELVHEQAGSAIDRLVTTLRDAPTELPGDLEPDRSTPGWLVVPLDAAVRFTGLSKTRMRLSVGADSPVQIRQGHVYIPAR